MTSHTLKGNLLLKYQNAVYRREAALAKLATKELEIKVLAQTDEIFAKAIVKMSERAELKADTQTAQDRFQKINKQVCEKINITPEQLRDYTIDVETGRITYLPKEE